jgi:hypothetical protein
VYADYDVLFSNTLPMSGTMGGGAHNIVGDPKFTAPANDDYHLASGSAAINQGVFVGVSFDLDGRPRIGAPDIGAYEFAQRVYLPLVQK